MSLVNCKNALGHGLLKHSLNNSHRTFLGCSAPVIRSRFTHVATASRQGVFMTMCHLTQRKMPRIQWWPFCSYLQELWFWLAASATHSLTEPLCLTPKKSKWQRKGTWCFIVHNLIKLWLLFSSVVTRLTELPWYQDPTCNRISLNYVRFKIIILAIHVFPLER